MRNSRLKIRKKFRLGFRTKGEQLVLLVPPRDQSAPQTSLTADENREPGVFTHLRVNFLKTPRGQVVKSRFDVFA